MNQEQAAEKKLAASIENVLAAYSEQIRGKFASIRDQATELLSLLENETDSISPAASLEEILQNTETHLEQARLPYRQKIQWTQQFQTAVHRVYSSLTQREVLEKVMDAAGLVSGRCLLLVIKKGNAAGWDARGYSDTFIENDLKPFAVDMDDDFLACRMLREKKIFTLNTADVPVTEALLEIPNWPKPSRLVAVPLCLFNVVSAILVLDADRIVPDLDEAIPAVDTLMFVASLWLENLTMRKSLGIEGIPQPPVTPVQREALLSAAAPPLLETAPPAGPVAPAAPVVTETIPEEPAMAEELPAAEPLLEEEIPAAEPIMVEEEEPEVPVAEVEEEELEVPVAEAEEEKLEAPVAEAEEEIPAETLTILEETQKEVSVTLPEESVEEEDFGISAPLAEAGGPESAAVAEGIADEDMQQLFADVASPVDGITWEEIPESPVAIEEEEALSEIPTSPVMESDTESSMETGSESILDQVMPDTAPYPGVERRPSPETSLSEVEEIPRFEEDLARQTFQEEEEYDAGATVMDGIPTLTPGIEIPDEIIPGEEMEEVAPETEDEEIVLEEKPLEDLILEETPVAEEYKPPFKFTPLVEPPKPAAPPAPVWTSPEEEKLHNDARRFARLLVSEIKLYNEDAVTEGRIEKDLFSRLKRDIERSREMYGKRIPAEVTRKVDYFHEEIVRILGEGDISKLGPNYPGAQSA